MDGSRSKTVTRFRRTAGPRGPDDQTGVRRSGRALTLVELVVVASVVTLLVSLLVPSLADARRAARRVKCLANCRALAFAAGAYASENADWLPPSAQRHDGADHFELSANIVNLRDVGYALPSLMGPYIHPAAFSCPEPPAPAVDDPSNRAQTVYSTYIFLWGASQSTPQRGAMRMSTADQSLAVADFTWYRLLDDDTTIFGGNHVRKRANVGTIPEADLVDNPSAAQYVARHNPRHILGLNAARLSGSAAWYPQRRGSWGTAGPYNQGSGRHSSVYVPAR